MRFLLVGNYGVGNLGDEALKNYFLKSFPEVEWRVVSARPAKDELSRLPCGIRSFLALRWFRTVLALRNVDGLVFGGGSLFTDTESVRACMLWGIHAWVAWVFRTPIFLAFQGIGPFRTVCGERMARFVVSHATFISVRDSSSARRMESWKKNIKVIQSFDPVFIDFLRKNSDRSKDVFIIIPRASGEESLRKAVTETLGKKSFSKTSILLLEPENESEQGIAGRLRTMIPGATIVPIRSIDELKREIEGAGLVLSARYHGAIAALAAGKEIMLIPERAGDKLSALEECIPMTDEKKHALLERIEAGKRELRASLGH